MPNDPKAGTPNADASHPDPAAETPASGAAIRRVSSEALFAGTREIEIDHNGRLYHLRVTQTGKLILTA